MVGHPDLQSNQSNSAPTAVPWGPRQVGLALLGLLVLWGVGIGVASVLPVDLDGSAYWPLAVAAALEGAFLLVAWWMGPGRLRAPLALLGFRQTRGSLLGWGLAALVASLLLTALYVTLVESIGVDRLLPPSLPEELRVEDVPLFAFLVVAVWGPLAEETFFRGFVLNGLSRQWGFWAGAIGSALLFAASHGFTGLFIPVFMSGLVLAWVYRRTGSLWPAVLAHSTQNAIALAVVV